MLREFPIDIEQEIRKSENRKQEDRNERNISFYLSEKHKKLQEGIK